MVWDEASLCCIIVTQNLPNENVNVVRDDVTGEDLAQESAQTIAWAGQLPGLLTTAVGGAYGKGRRH
jgi:hypothetical protein